MNTKRVEFWSCVVLIGVLPLVAGMLKREQPSMYPVALIVVGLLIGVLGIAQMAQVSQASLKAELLMREYIVWCASPTTFPEMSRESFLQRAKQFELGSFGELLTQQWFNDLARMYGFRKGKVPKMEKLS